MKQPIPHKNALALVLNNLPKLGIEKAPPGASLGRTLRKPVKADRPIPPFNRSAMDGYAARHADLRGGEAVLHCVGTLEAGKKWKGKLKPGQTVKIMTGAPVPDGADIVIKVEEAKRSGDRVTLKEGDKWLNVHRMGSDAAKGDVLIEEGTELDPLNLAVAASVAERLSITRLPKVTVISTGSELVPAGKIPRSFQIRDTNSTHLMTRLAGISKAVFGGIVRDDRNGLKKTIGKALGKSDVVIVTGGVSMGDSDFTGPVLKSLGVERIFHKCAIRPGKPVWFGVKGKTAVFGLPGNPVSIAVTFHEFVLPALRKMSGMADAGPNKYFPRLASGLTKKNRLKEFRVARIAETGWVEGVKSYGGSGDLVSTAKSDGLIVIPEEAKELSEGTVVEFHPWGF